MSSPFPTTFFLFSFLIGESFPFSFFDSKAPMVIQTLSCTATRMGLRPVPSFYRAKGTADGLRNGLNFGTVPATILSGEYASLFRAQGLSQQIRQFYDVLQLLQLQMRTEVFREIVSSAVLYLSFGRDDFIDLFFLDSSGLIPKYGRRGFPRILVPQMMQAIEVINHLPQRPPPSARTSGRRL